MNILIKNCNLISMSEQREKIEYNTDIYIEGNIIKLIDKDLENKLGIKGDEIYKNKLKETIIDTKKNIKIIDAHGKVAMPGLVNTHSHISMSVFRETVDGYKTQDWLEKEIWPREDKLNGEEIYWATKLSCIEMIRTGTTTINDMYFLTDNIIKAAIETGIRLQTTYTLIGNDPKDDSRFNVLEKIINNYNEETITFNVGIHGLYTSNEEYLKKCIEFAKNKNLIIHMHFCENQQEREDIIKEYKVNNPTEVIEKHFKGIHNILAHSVKINDKDIANLTKTNSYISHCPVSNLKLGCGIAPISKILQSGICVSLGTDGQGSGSNLDMFETMKFTALLQKGINENPELLPAYQVLKMATINGAKTLKLEEKIGSIEEGKIADLILIDLSSILTEPINNIFAEIVYNVKGYNVDTTIINGKILMENKQINIDESDTIKKCNDIIKKISK